MKGYPRWFSKNRITALVAVVFLTGLFLLPTTLDFRLNWDVPWRLSGGQRIYVVAAHVLFGFLMMMVLGALWSIHMRVGWRQKRHRRSGIILAFVWVLLMVTGVGIYYCGQEWLVNLTSLCHTVIGVLVVFAYYVHLRLSRSRKMSQAGGRSR